MREKKVKSVNKARWGEKQQHKKEIVKTQATAKNSNHWQGERGEKPRLESTDQKSSPPPGAFERNNPRNIPT